jgi:hypothetical protein
MNMYALGPSLIVVSFVLTVRWYIFAVLLDEKSEVFRKYIERSYRFFCNFSSIFSKFFTGTRTRQFVHDSRTIDFTTLIRRQFPLLLRHFNQFSASNQCCLVDGQRASFRAIRDSRRSHAMPVNNQLIIAVIIVHVTFMYCSFCQYLARLLLDPFAV